jgi:hypothetical protein
MSGSPSSRLPWKIRGQAEEIRAETGVSEFSTAGHIIQDQAQFDV